MDKLLHFLASYFIATLVGWWAIIPAIGKEAYDLFGDKKAGRAWRWKDSLLDLLADMLGVIIAIGVMAWHNLSA